MHVGSRHILSRCVRRMLWLNWKTADVLERNQHLHVYFRHSNHTPDFHKRVHEYEPVFAYYIVMRSCRKCWKEHCKKRGSQGAAHADEQDKRFWFLLTSRCTPSVVLAGDVVLMGAFVGITTRAGAPRLYTTRNTPPTLQRDGRCLSRNQRRKLGVDHKYRSHFQTFLKLALCTHIINTTYQMRKCRIKFSIWAVKCSPVKTHAWILGESLANVRSQSHVRMKMCISLCYFIIRAL
jgi:hypothetical protein